MSDTHKNRRLSALRYLQARDVSYWFDERERIVAVSLSGNSDADEIAVRVGCLHDLRHLQFEETDVTDAGLRHLTPLVKLKQLALRNPYVTGDGFACLARMTRLQELSLGGEQLEGRGFQHFANLCNLIELSIAGGKFRDDDLSAFASLAMLEQISIDGVPTLHGTFADYLIGLPRLRNLVVNPRITDEGLASISGLSQLQELRLEGPFTDAGLLQLQSLTVLQKLELHSQYVTSLGVAVVTELPRLESLCLNTPRVTDDVIPWLERCSALEDLDFRTPALTEAGLQKIRDAMPRCEVRDLVRDHYEGRPEDGEQKSRPRYENDTPFEILLTDANDWDLVGGTFSKISDRYKHWVDASGYTPIERIVMLVWHVTGLIDNGGFEYLFADEIPGDPDFRICAEAFKIVGLSCSYEAFQDAFRLFPGEIVPCDPGVRLQLYEKANCSARAATNRKFWRDGSDHLVEKKLAEFIRAHATEFAYLNDVP